MWHRARGPGSEAEANFTISDASTVWWDLSKEQEYKNIKLVTILLKPVTISTLHLTSHSWSLEFIGFLRNLPLGRCDRGKTRPHLKIPKTSEKVWDSTGRAMGESDPALRGRQDRLTAGL